MVELEHLYQPEMQVEEVEQEQLELQVLVLFKVQEE
jgi:hypothetical protein